MKYVCFEAFFTHILLHEVAHSNGPHYLVNDKSKTVRSALHEYHSILEEAKADIVGLFAVIYYVEINKIQNVSKESFYTTYLASAFRSIRFGLNEAHGMGQAIQLNYLIEKEGIITHVENTYSVDFDKTKNAVDDLCIEIMEIQGDGDFKRAKEFVEKYGVIHLHTKKALEKINHVPIDINPVFKNI